MSGRTVENRTWRSLVRSTPPNFTSRAPQRRNRHRGQARTRRRLLVKRMEKAAFLHDFHSAARPRIRSARSPTCRLQSGTKRALSARTSTSSYAALGSFDTKGMYHDATMIVRDNGEAMIPIFGDFSDKRKLSDRNQPKRVRRPSEERHDSSPNPHLRAVPRIGGLNRSTPSAKAGLRGHPQPVVQETSTTRKTSPDPASRTRSTRSPSQR